MSPERRHAIYRVSHDTGIAARKIVRECRGLNPIEIARRYSVLFKPARSG